MMFSLAKLLDICAKNIYFGYFQIIPQRMQFDCKLQENQTRFSPDLQFVNFLEGHVMYMIDEQQPKLLVPIR